MAVPSRRDNMYSNMVKRREKKGKYIEIIKAPKDENAVNKLVKMWEEMKNKERKKRL